MVSSLSDGADKTNLTQRFDWPERDTVMCKPCHTCRLCWMRVPGINPAHSSFAQCLQPLTCRAMQVPSGIPACMWKLQWKWKQSVNRFSSTHCLSDLLWHQIIDGLELYYTNLCTNRQVIYIMIWSLWLFFFSAQMCLFFQVIWELFAELSIPLLHLLSCWHVKFGLLQAQSPDTDPSIPYQLHCNLRFYFWLHCNLRFYFW